MQIVTAIEWCVDLTTLTICFKAHDERVRKSFGDAHGDDQVMLTRDQWQALNSKEKNGSEGSSSGNCQERAPIEQGRKHSGDRVPKKKSLIRERSSTTIVGSWDT